MNHPSTMKKATVRPPVQGSASEEMSDPRVELATLTGLPAPVLASGTLDQTWYPDVIGTLSRQKALLETHPNYCSVHFHKFLGFCLNVLDLEVQDTPQAGSYSDPSNTLSPRKVVLNLRPREEVDLKLRSLENILSLVKLSKKSKVFSFWYAFLPGCKRLSPYKSGVFDLIDDLDDGIRQLIFSILQAFFDGSSSFLQLANAHCRTTSFTPVCYEFAESLFTLMTTVVKFLDSQIFLDPQWASLISRTLVVLLEQLPFHKLKEGLLSATTSRVLRLSPAANPVIQIAVLQICSALLSVTPTNPEVREYFDGFLQLFVSRSFLVDVHHDNNIRYVALQDLGKLATLDLEAFLQNIETIFPNFDSALKDKDQSITLHVLRLIKTVVKSGATEAAKNHSDKTTEKVIKFWLEILKPSFLGVLESRDSNIVRAAFADCLSEIGDEVLARLPTDKRNLCISYLLRQCRNEDHRVVASAFRGLGMVVTLPACQSDSLFMADCADILLEAFLHQSTPVHRNVALSGTWAMANLADTLAKQHSTLAGDFEMSLEGDAVEFPPHLLLQLVRVAILFSKPDPQSHMNTRANCVRALGSLIQCFDSMASHGFPGGGSDSLAFAISSQRELQELCQQVVDTLIRAIQTDKVMKVRWNACYAVGGILRTTLLYASDTTGQRLCIIEALLPLVEKFQNFKVRINAAYALKCIERRSVMGNRYQEVVLCTARALDTAHLVEGELEEIQHKTDLVDQLCLTFCHLVSLGSSQDLVTLNSTLAGYTDILNQSLKTVSLRISPEKASTFIETRRQLMATISDGPTAKNENLVAIFSGLDSYICA